MAALRRIVFFAIAANAVFLALLAALKRLMPSEGDPDSDELALTAIMEGKTLRSRAAAFRGGSVLTAAGALALDLRGATLAPGGAFLEVRAVMGATSVAVPATWRVNVRGQGVLGAVADHTVSPATDGDALTIDALAVMGSIEVGYKLMSLGTPDADTPAADPDTRVVPTVV
jgi:hypothetical protein